MHNAESRVFTIGAEVMTSDGEPLGSVAYVVVQPPQLHVTNAGKGHRGPGGCGGTGR